MKKYNQKGVCPITFGRYCMYKPFKTQFKNTSGGFPENRFFLICKAYLKNIHGTRYLSCTLKLKDNIDIKQFIL